VGALAASPYRGADPLPYPSPASGGGKKGVSAEPRYFSSPTTLTTAPVSLASSSGMIVKAGVR
jgi:hypothetical protein